MRNAADGTWTGGPILHPSFIVVGCVRRSRTGTPGKWLHHLRADSGLPWPVGSVKQYERPCWDLEQQRIVGVVQRASWTRIDREDAGVVMSIDVSLRRLADAVTRYHFAYLLTVGDDERAHVGAVHAILDNDTLVVEDPGRKTHTNLASHPVVTLV
jgi:hypothetical protein